ncbi:MAG: hypothetical protein A2X18_01435 [Bacteroidetes bacterium GWF2_40_14]|nr:MAG: hypothetical protein A2X18_01435 [Bacteroidetes bacterium GWF2_40_14]
MIEGGVMFMVPIYTLWLAVICLSVLVVVFLFTKAGRNRKLMKRMSDWILFLGSMAFLLGILGHTLGLIQILEVIQQIGAVSQNVLAGGLKVAMYPAMFGFVLLIFAFVVWFVMRTFGREEEI